LSNLGEPRNIINDILQLRLERAAKTTGRLIINSTLGIGGLVDVAANSGLEHQGTTFSITMGRYGVKTGPYLYLPLAGPSTVRGVIGTVVDGALDPLYWIRFPDKAAFGFSRGLVSGLDLRSESDGSLKSLISDATDPYATIRSAYLQNQQSQIDDAPVQSLPDFDDTPAPAAPPNTGADKPEAPPTETPATPPAPNPPAPAPATNDDGQ